MSNVSVPALAMPAAGDETRVMSHPDYDLPDDVVADQPEQLKALGDRTRLAILDLVLERAATITELATALGRPKSTVAHHVEVLQRAGLLKVVRTRKVRAVTESFYGRTGRTVQAVGTGPDHPMGDMLRSALAEYVPPPEGAESGGFTLRHARISPEQADEFVRRVFELALEFTGLPRSGDVVFGFVAGVYPTNQATLPPTEDEA
jgi:DNA-binding transcriptional ArsR family regulator